MQLRILFICLATILLSSLLLFMYFKNKTVSLEKKLEIMFSLIQNHVEEKPLQKPTFQGDRVNLIEVSENEESDDSDSDSDDESICVDNVKNISLKLDEDVIFSNETDKEITVTKKKNSFDIDNEVEKVCDEMMSNCVHNKLCFEFDKVDDEDTLDNVNDNVNDDVNNTVNNIVDDLVDKVDGLTDDLSDNVDVQDTVIHDICNLKVLELKKICNDRGLTGYKKLKKQQLVDLLNK
jgi:hypothetical protein